MDLYLKNPSAGTWVTRSSHAGKLLSGLARLITSDSTSTKAILPLQEGPIPLGLL